MLLWEFFYFKKVKEADLLKSCFINWWNDVVKAINSWYYIMTMALKFPQQKKLPNIIFELPPLSVKKLVEIIS